MPIVKIITPVGVDVLSGDRMDVTLNLNISNVVGEGEEQVITTLINHNFTATHNPHNDIDVVEGAFLEQMQAYIDNYKTEKAILNSDAMAAMIANIEANLEI